MADLDRRQFLRRGLMVLGALTGAGAISELVGLAATPGSSTSSPTPGAARLPAASATTITGPTPSTPPPPPPWIAPNDPQPGGPPIAEAVRWPEPTPGVQPSAGFVLRVPVLMYHRVVDPGQAGDSLPGLVVPPQLFAAQLTLLHDAGWHTVTLAQLAQDLERGRAVPRRTCVITFDDGWLDGVTQALPLLQRLGFAATYFVIGGRIDRPGFLGASDLRELVAAGMEIGDHTFDHVSLPRLDPARQRYEIAAASQRIAQVVGQAPVTFSYPAGRWSPALEELLAQQGFGLAVTTEEGTGSTWPNRFVVPRQRVSPSTSPGSLLARLELTQLGW
jgi:peptidoglycan/xylan/chitin deacetylase (PgdA/CDA1 family)